VGTATIWNGAYATQVCNHLREKGQCHFSCHQDIGHCRFCHVPFSQHPCPRLDRDLLWDRKEMDIWSLEAPSPEPCTEMPGSAACRSPRASSALWSEHDGQVGSMPGPYQASMDPAWTQVPSVRQWPLRVGPSSPVWQLSHLMLREHTCAHWWILCLEVQVPISKYMKLSSFKFQLNSKDHFSINTFCAILGTYNGMCLQ
jgi:hypothetical protein